MGKLIVIDGLDGSGKGTQSKKLEQYLKEHGVRIRRLEFPRYGTKGCTLVEGYLHAELGNHPEDTNAYAASLFFGMDRYWSYRTEWKEFYEEPDTVLLCDRYTSANAVHQLSKLPKEEWKTFLDWLWDVEFTKIGLPAPDQVVYLEMDPDVSVKLINERAGTEGREKDIHESDSAYLRRCYEAAMYASDALSWTRISCCKDGFLRTREDIFEEILDKTGLRVKEN